MRENDARDLTRRRWPEIGAATSPSGMDTTSPAAASDRDERVRTDGAGPPDGLGPDHAGANTEHFALDYDDYDQPHEVYTVNDVRSGIQPRFVTDPVYEGETALETEFADGEAKTANVEYRFPEHPDHDGLNQYDRPWELSVRFRLYPADIELNESATVRIFWLPLTNGPGSSGGGQPDGTNGWSNAIGFAHRNDSPAPDGYHFFSYTYHLDASGDFEMTDVPIWMDEWNLIEGYVRCNTFHEGTANNDGVMRYWVNGELAYERDDFALTTTEANLIEGTGPLGYVVGDDLGGSKLIYDGHRMAISSDPVRTTGNRRDDETLDGDDFEGETEVTSIRDRSRRDGGP